MTARQYVDPCHCSRHEDEVWVRELQAGTPQVKDDLWEVLYCRAATIARFRQTDIDQKHDAVVAAYLRLMNRGIYRFNFHGSFCGYMRVILINEIYRRFPPPDQEPVELPGEDDGDDPTGEPDPAIEELEVRGWLAALEDCLGELQGDNALLYEVIQLYYFQRLSVREIAGRLGKKENNIHQLLWRGRVALQDCLMENGFTADLLPAFE